MQSTSYLHYASYCGRKTFLVLILFSTLQVGVIRAELSCHYCKGINCIRTTYKGVEKCTSDVSVCATVFNGETVEAQGCLDTIEENLREKCRGSAVDHLNQCHKCNEDLCNEWAPSDFQCIQCDSKKDPNCAKHGEDLEIQPSRCPISRTPNMLCYALKDGDTITRGCSSTLQEQKTCMTSEECFVCNPLILPACNNILLKDGPPKPKPTSKPNPNAGSAISIRVEHYLILLVAYACKYF
ncbi:uncharacterized protein LOC106081343 [Stomoxys calcitrans]|uniref:DUF753 domain-containing protein n=1 Tax=Stomoxys calcitrans TaxID=35570 RepID=A0A1I8NRX7_STOCA|nr:uncharacterized protein LOC106081343 [Stomoxys calcitrans]XP_059224811.1 uncharacterized protein LOC131997646 [Stomoxys calcitrans]XP_059224812.1 uncharacterized protein LOC106081343 [Stomoxys calcitrans]